MIKLDVKEYCYDCPSFDVRVMESHQYHYPKSTHNFTITCKNAAWCERIASTVEERLKERGNN